MSTSERRAGDQVTFERGIEAWLMGIDGTWRRDCTMHVVSEQGATLTVVGSMEGLNLTEFFLLLSKTGLAYRRCKLERVQGEQIAVSFFAKGKKKPSVSREETVAGSHWSLNA